MLTGSDFTLDCRSAALRMSIRKSSATWSKNPFGHSLRSPCSSTLTVRYEVPILVEENGTTICGIYPLIEYFTEKYSAVDLMPETIEDKSEVRRMLAWFNNKFYKEVSNYILEEKLIRPKTSNEAPRTAILRAAKINLKYQLRYLSYLIEQRGFFAIDKFTFADIAAASHISVLDYFNEIFWDQYPALKEWYLIVKSKPSFRPILNDTIKGIKASNQYSLLDF